MSGIANAIIPYLLLVLLAFLVWAAIEIALSVRRVRSTLDKVDETVKKADPLIEHATLTVDAVNLEIMRIDQILEDVEQVTDSAAGAVDAVETVASAPREIATSVADFLRGSVKSHGRRKAAEKTLDAEQRAALSGDECEPASRRAGKGGITIIKSPLDEEQPASSEVPAAGAADERDASAPAGSAQEQPAPESGTSPDDGADAA